MKWIIESIKTICSMLMSLHVYGQEKALRSFDSGVFYSDIKECHECVISGIVAREYKI